MLRSSLFVAFLSLMLFSVGAEEKKNRMFEKMYDYFSGDDDVLEKSRFYYRAFDHADEAWVSKGRLFHVIVYAQTRMSYFYYFGEGESDRLITDGSLQSAVAIFEKEGLAQLDADSIRDISMGFLFPMMTFTPINQIVSESYYCTYQEVATSQNSPVPESDLLLLQGLIGKDIDNPIVVRNNESTGRWAVNFFVLTANGGVESWEFSGTNDKAHFTVDTLNRKVLDVKIKRLSLTG